MAHTRSLQCFLLPCGTSAFVMAFREQKVALLTVSGDRGTLGTSHIEQEPQQLLSELEKWHGLPLLVGCFPLLEAIKYPLGLGTANHAWVRDHPWIL